MPKPTTRRLLQQAKHCIEEALSVMAADEDSAHALADTEQALELLESHIIPTLKSAHQVRR